MMTHISKTKIVMHYITWCKQTFCLYLFLARANVEGDVKHAVSFLTNTLGTRVYLLSYLLM